MKICISHITSKGLDVEGSIKMKDADLSLEEIGILSDLSVKAHAVRTSEYVVVDVKVKGEFSHQCGRCLDSFQSKEVGKYTFDYSLDECGDYIDLTEEIRQEVIVSANPWVLYDLNDQGVCQQCGKNVKELEIV